MILICKIQLIQLRYVELFVYPNSHVFHENLWEQELYKYLGSKQTQVSYDFIRVSADILVIF